MSPTNTHINLKAKSNSEVCHETDKPVFTNGVTLQEKDNTIHANSAISQGKGTQAPATELSRRRANPMPSAIKISQVPGSIPNNRTFSMTQESFQRFQQLLSDRNFINVTSGQGKGNIPNKTQNGSHQITLQRTPANCNSMIYMAKNGISCESQQPPVRIPTNLTPNQITNPTESPSNTTNVVNGNKMLFNSNQINKKHQLKLNVSTNQILKNNKSANSPSQSLNRTNIVRNFVREDSVVTKSANIAPIQSQNSILAKQLNIPATNNTTHVRRNSTAGQQLNIMSVASKIPDTSSATFSLITIPSQTTSVSSPSVMRVSASHIPNNTAVLPPCLASPSNVGDVLVSHQFGNKSPQQLSTVTSSQLLSKPVSSPHQLSSVLPPHPLSTVTSSYQLPTVTSSHQLPTFTSQQKFSTTTSQQQLSTATSQRRLSTVISQQQLSPSTPQQQFPTTTSQQQLSTATPQRRLSTVISQQQLSPSTPQQQLSTAISQPQVYTVTSRQQLSTVTSPPSQPSLNNLTSSNNLPGQKANNLSHQQKSGMLNGPHLQQPGLNQTTSTAPIIIRSVVDPAAPAIIGMDSNQLLMRKLHESSTTNTDIATIPEKASSSSSPLGPTSPEATSPTAEVNLPSSSHCHPFIARRPISGKMKMLFGSNSSS